MIIYKLDVEMDTGTPWVSLETKREIGFLNRYAAGDQCEDISKLRFEFIVEGIPGGRRKMKDADIYHAGTGVHAFSLDAVRVLAPLIEAQGSRFEPIKCEGKTLFVWTGIPEIQAIDTDKSVEPTTSTFFDQYIFSRDRVDNLVLFMDAATHGLETYCTEVVKQAVEKAKLRGFKFTQLWPEDPKAKAKAAKKRAKSEKKPKPKKPKERKEPKPSVQSLDAETVAEYNDWVAQWEAISDLSTSKDAPELVLRRICEQLMERAKEENASDEFAMMAGMAAARVYERSLNWKLQRVTLDGQVSYGCVAPDKSHVLMPFDSVFAALDEGEDPTLLLWFNMIREGGAPESKPGALLMLE